MPGDTRSSSVHDAGPAASAVPAPSPAVAAATPSTDESAIPAINMKLLEELAGDDRATTVELMASIHAAFGDSIPEMGVALDSGDLAVIKATSHKLKGSAGMVGAGALVAVCHRIETAASAGDAAPMSTLRALFEHEAQRTLTALRSYCA